MKSPTYRAPRRAARIADRGLFAAALVLLAFLPSHASVAPAAGPLPVGFKLQSPQNGATVSAGQLIKCNIRVFANAADNQGLALALTDFEQDPGNPELFDIPPSRRPNSMALFDRPLGFANPNLEEPDESAYGGTQVGRIGERNLAQIGGAQNTFGVPGGCFGPNNEVCSGLNTTVATGVAQPFVGQLLATVSFFAPATPGTYTFRIKDPVASVLDQVNAPPMASTVMRTPVIMNQNSITFVVQ